MRGLRNALLSLNRTGSYIEALDICEKLDRECGDTNTAARSFYEQLLAHPIVSSLIEDMEAVIIQSHKRDGSEWRDAFDRLHEMRSTNFSMAQAQRITAALSQ